MLVLLSHLPVLVIAVTVAASIPPLVEDEFLAVGGPFSAAIWTLVLV